MRNNLEITERDIFNYIFFPELVKEEIKMHLSAKENFTDAIIFYKELKAEIKKDLTPDIKKKIAEKIPAYRIENVIELYPLKEPKAKKQNGGRLAAASADLIPQMTTKTFVDNAKEYLIKVLNYGETTKLFVFSTKNEVVKNFDIIIEPQKLQFHCEDNSEPLLIDHLIDAEKIQLKFNGA